MRDDDRERVRPGELVAPLCETESNNWEPTAYEANIRR